MIERALDGVAFLFIGAALLLIVSAIADMWRRERRLRRLGEEAKKGEDAARVEACILSNRFVPQQATGQHADAPHSGQCVRGGVTVWQRFWLRMMVGSQLGGLVALLTARRCDALAWGLWIFGVVLIVVAVVILRSGKGARR